MAGGKWTKEEDILPINFLVTRAVLLPHCLMPNGMSFGVDEQQCNGGGLPLTTRTAPCYSLFAC